MLTPEKRAWAEGHKAGQLRQPKDNPYEPNTENGQAWLKGYKEGTELPQLNVPKSKH